MRNRLPLAIAAVLALLLGWRACAQRPEAPPADAATASADAGSARVAPETRAADNAPPHVATATRQAFSGAASTVHAYLADVAGGDPVRANRWWAGSDPGTPPGDALLRGPAPVRSMKINTGVGRALDGEAPPRAVEVPVRLRLDRGDGRLQRVQGHYWLRARIHGDGWEITSASLQPELD